MRKPYPKVAQLATTNSAPFMMLVLDNSALKRQLNVFFFFNKRSTWLPILKKARILQGLSNRLAQKQPDLTLVVNYLTIQ